MAYRTSDYTRYQNLDFVVGIEVHLSNNHTLNGQPFEDICDQLKGRYPKDFKFTGWHPLCRCHVTSVLKTREELFADNERIMRGEEPTTESVNSVTKVPDEFTKWLDDNQAKMERAQSLPYFMRDNEKYCSEIRITNAARKGADEAQSFNQLMADITVLKPKTLLELAAERHAQRTPEQIQAIKDARIESLKKHEQIRKMANNVLTVAKDYAEVDWSVLEDAIVSGNLNKMKSQAKALARSIADMKRQEKALSDILTDVHQWHKQVPINNLRKIRESIIDKLSLMPSDLDSRFDRLEFEINWIAKKGKEKYPTTYKISLTAYKKQLLIVENAIERRHIEKDINKVLLFADSMKHKSKVLKTLASEMRDILSIPNYDVSIAKKKAKELIKKYNSLSIFKESKTGITHETLKEIKERLGNKFPKTLENLQKLIDSKKEIYDFTKNQRDNMRNFMLNLINDSDYGMNIPLFSNNGDNVVESIFNSRFKNQLETGTGKGMEDIKERIIASRYSFGTPKNTLAKEYEKYGFLMDRDMLKQAHSSTAGQYWNYGDGIQVRFRKDKVIATFTYNDSLDGGFHPSLTTDPEVTSFNKYNAKIFNNPLNKMSAEDAKELFNTCYIELQYHGNLTLDCIESVFIPEKVLQSISKETLQKIFGCGAKVYTEKGGKLVGLNH